MKIDINRTNPGQRLLQIMDLVKLKKMKSTLPSSSVCKTDDSWKLKLSSRRFDLQVLDSYRKSLLRHISLLIISFFAIRTPSMLRKNTVFYSYTSYARDRHTMREPINLLKIVDLQHPLKIIKTHGAE